MNLEELGIGALIGASFGADSQLQKTIGRFQFEPNNSITIFYNDSTQSNSPPVAPSGQSVIIRSGKWQFSNADIVRMQAEPNNSVTIFYDLASGDRGQTNSPPTPYPGYALVNRNGKWEFDPAQAAPEPQAAPSSDGPQFGPSAALAGPGKPGPVENAWVQHSLNLLGANPKLVEDGQLGPKSQAALRAYQQSRGLPASGNADAATKAKLADDLSAPNAPGFDSPAPGAIPQVPGGLNVAPAPGPAPRPTPAPAPRPAPAPKPTAPKPTPTPFNPATNALTGTVKPWMMWAGVGVFGLLGIAALTGGFHAARKK